MLQVATEVLEAKDRKSRARFGFVPPVPQTYSREALRMGYQIEQATGDVILNPHNLKIRSLVDVDEDWLVDRAIFHDWLEFAEENAKTGETIKKLGL